MCCEVPPISIVMEHCKGGSLQNHLQEFGDKIAIGERILYGIEVAKGMCYLQQKNLIHRDLATRNCLISKYGIIKISDFGLSQLITDPIPNIKSRGIPVRWMAPETIQRQPKYSFKSDVWSYGVLLYEIFNNGIKPWPEEDIPVRWMAPETIQRQPKYSFKSDVWSYGVLLYEIFNNGIKPWPEEDVRQCATFIRQGEMPNMPDISPMEIVDLVKECWKMDFEKRCDFDQIMKKFELIQCLYAIPRKNDLTIAKVKDVKILTELDAKIQEEKSDREEELLIMKYRAKYNLCAKSKISSGTPHNVAFGRVVGRNELARRLKMRKENEILNDNILTQIEEELRKKNSMRGLGSFRKQSKRRVIRRSRRSRNDGRKYQINLRSQFVGEQKKDNEQDKELSISEEIMKCLQRETNDFRQLSQRHRKKHSKMRNHPTISPEGRRESPQISMKQTQEAMSSLEEKEKDEKIFTNSKKHKAYESRRR
uniref:Protein kinase domain-containing protein n=1 Tax=Setaria digitata TaxID=48799 RepID=A0A915PI53_9BILA